MAGYTKLFSDIVMSTIWREDDKTRLVWITMLATADALGRVNASVPGLADAARVSVDECRKALAKLSAPDPDSRTKENEGRRIREISGGWLILNYMKYRERRDPEKRREQNRVAQHKYRQTHPKQADSKPEVSQNQPKSAQAEAEAEAYKKVYCRTSDEVRLSTLLLSLILERKPDYKKPNTQSWARHIDLMLRIDKRSAERIEKVMRWCQADYFWQNNVLGTKKLREKFDRLEMDMTKPPRGKYDRKPKPIRPLPPKYKSPVVSGPSATPEQISEIIANTPRMARLLHRKPKESEAKDGNTD